MRVYCSARRYAFNRWLEGKQSLNELRKEIQELLGLNSRYAHPAIVDAKAIIYSQKELLPLYILNLKNKIKVTTKKLKKNEDKLKKLSGKEAEIQKIKISGIKQRLNKLIKKKQEYEEHLKNKTLPKIVFGGKKNFNLLKKGKISKEEWKELRSNQVYSIGRKVDKGNQNLRLTYLKDNFFELRIN
ncbi:MAG: hypothetical protein ACE5KT_11225, partial [Methanosarcinales archaeon]